MYEIRKIHSNEVMEALALALEVFLQFEAPDYKPEGIETFKRDIVENDEFIQNVNKVSALYMRRLTRVNDWNYRYVFKQEAYQLSIHKEEYHRQGVATSIFQYLLADILKDAPKLHEITLNSSPYGKPFYLHIGFKPQSDEQEIDGIRFTPMKYTI